MSAQYERVNVGDNDAAPVSPSQLGIPNSPPPSFHSRASSRSSGRTQPLNQTLADAFADPDASEARGTEDASDDDDDDDDDRARLIRSRNALRPLRAPASASPAAAAAAASSPARSSTNISSNTGSATPMSSSSTSQPAQTSGRVYGGGIQSDGVFSNITARPEPGEEKDEQPPTYEQAAADAVPPYWETTILAPGLGGPDDVFVDGMPVGSLFSFVWNGMISVSFQFVGFLLTYLLHSTHAAKNGSRAGLGMTLIQYGFYMKGMGADDAGGSSAMTAAGSAAAAGGGSGDGYTSPPDPNAHDFDPGNVNKDAEGGGGGGSGVGGSLAEMASSEWVAYALMIVGWFIVFRATHDYLRARRHEQLVLQSPDRGLGVAVIAEGEGPERVV